MALSKAPIYGFILLISSICGSILHRFSNTARNYWLKSPIIPNAVDRYNFIQIFRKAL